MSNHAPTSALPAVLVVEDEFVVRLNLFETMLNNGFRTYEAASADEAMEILESRPDIGVVFTDVNMPGSMDGLALAQRVRQHWPSIRVVITSGRAPPPAEMMAGAVAFVPKPYRVGELPGFFRNIAAA
ncbi:MAG: response regulator [Bauldia sp.]